MKYEHLKEWLEAWVEKQPDRPIPLLMAEHSISRDVRFAIRSKIERIEAITPAKRKNSSIALIEKNHLQEIKEAIDDDRFDISSFGYSINSNYIQRK